MAWVYENEGGMQRTSLNKQLLVLLLILCASHKGDEEEAFWMEYPGEGTRKSVIKRCILTVEEDMKEKLEQAEERI